MANSFILLYFSYSRSPSGLCWGQFAALRCQISEKHGLSQWSRMPLTVASTCPLSNISNPCPGPDTFPHCENEWMRWDLHRLMWCLKIPAAWSQARWRQWKNFSWRQWALDQGQRTVLLHQGYTETLHSSRICSNQHDFHFGFQPPSVNRMFPIDHRDCVCASEPVSPSKD